jgi:hypothetical protein
MKMGRFFLAKIIPALTLALFILLMNSGTFFKNFPGPTVHLPEYFSLLQTSIHQGEWPEVVAYLQKMQSAWRRLVPRIQFSEERDEINNFQRSLARMKGFVEARHKAGALAELRELEETWVNLGR